MQHPWLHVHPDWVLNTLEPLLDCTLTGLCLQRNSYINRVFEVENTDGERLIAKFYRPNRWSKDMILDEHRFLDHCAQQELPVIPPLSIQGKILHNADDIYVAIFPKKGGRAIDELSQEQWQECGRMLARVHQIGRQLTDTGRMVWTPHTATRQHLDTLLKLQCIPPDYEQVLTQTIERFIERATPAFEGTSMQLIHGDCHLGNLIYRPGEHMYLVDFDDCVIGPPIQDLWMLLPDEPEHCERELAWFTEGYNTFGNFSSQWLRLIPHLKIMRQVHFAAWCAVQQQDPHFENNFPEFGSARYWNELCRAAMS